MELSRYPSESDISCLTIPKRFTGRKPIPEYVVVLLIGLAIYGLITAIGLNALLIALLIIYLSAYILSLVLQQRFIVEE